MPINIIQKVLAELNQPEPRLDYVKGMLETLVDIQEISPMVVPTVITTNLPAKLPANPNYTADESTILDGQAKAMLDKVKGAATLE